MATPLELTQAHNCRQAVADIILSLCGEKIRVFESNAPSFVEIVRWEKDGENYLAVINQQDKTPVFPLDHIHITVAGNFHNVQMLSDTNTNVLINNHREKRS